VKVLLRLASKLLQNQPTFTHQKKIGTLTVNNRGQLN